MKIVFLDVKTIGEDLDLSIFEELGEVVRYPFTSGTEMEERVRDADVLVINKIRINEETISGAKKLKLVCVTATGTDNLDKEYLEKRGIAWRNVAGYSTESVAQHTFAMLFYLLENLRYYDDYVKEGRYLNDTRFTHFERQFHELHGRTWGIIGLGNIGRRVAEIAELFEQVNFDTLLRTSDIVSVHAPLNQYTENLMDEEAFSKMQSHAVFLNLGRGPIVNEAALAEALKQKKIGAAGLDVLSKEPMSKDCPLAELAGNDRLLITPHVGWASVEARTRLMEIIAGQIREFFS